ncbi:MAG: hypothetical protein QE278_02510 [Limnobacter sp.]|nr:hypothetical protein [Limnobacter sp.]
MKAVLEIYLWVGLLLGLLTLLFGMLRGRSRDQHLLMNGLKWFLGAGAVALAWPVAGYWVIEGELNRRRALRESAGKDSEKPVQL